MGNGKAVHFDVANLEAISGIEDAPGERCGVEFRDGFGGCSVGVNGQPRLACQHSKGLDVIGVFVGDQDAGEGLRGTTDGGEAGANLSRAQTRIDEEACVSRFEVGRVTGGTASENGELDGHLGGR